MKSKSEEFIKMSTPELIKSHDDLRSELFAYRFNQKLGKNSNSSLISKTRKNIARIRTEASRRKIETGEIIIFNSTMPGISTLNKKNEPKAKKQEKATKVKKTKVEANSKAEEK